MVRELPFRLVASAIFVYFLYFAIGALHAGFAPDDPMNLGEYWRIGFWRSVLDNLQFWSTAYRPMAAMFYLPIYHLFGMNPIPYRIAVFALLGSNLYLSFRIAEMLTGSRAVGTLTAVLVCAHGSMLPLYYNTSMIYDVLAYFFLAATLFFYVRFRQDGHELSLGQGALVMCAYVAALDSKELVVVGAGWVLLYELLFQRPWKLRVPILLVVVSVIYTLGKFLGPNPLSKQGGYLLEPTLHRYFVNNRLYLNDILSTRYFETSRNVIIVWCLLTFICAVARKRELWWCWVVVSTSTLGVSFTVQPRDGAALYVPLFGWALLISIFVAGFFKREAMQWAAVALVAVLAASRTVPLWNERRQAYFDDHALTALVISQIQDLPGRPSPKSRVLFLRNPFRDWDTYFIANLVWNDHTVDVQLANKLDHPPDLTRYDWVLDFEGDRLRVIRSH